MARKSSRSSRPRTPKRTATRLTVRLCQTATYGGETFHGESGRATHSLEVLWDAEARGLGLRLLPSGRKTWVLRFRHRGHQRIVNTPSLAQNSGQRGRPPANLRSLRRISGSILV